MKKLILLILIIVGGFIAYTHFSKQEDPGQELERPISMFSSLLDEPRQETPKEQDVSLITPPASKTLKSNYHVYQTFNNCGPASLSMVLSYFGINVSQQELGEQLRPFQHSEGNNDDKSVTLQELAKKSEEYGFVPFYRPNGDMNIIKYAIAYDIPVITKTWLSETEDTGHYRVVKGYNENTQELIQDDSLQGKNLKYKYEDFNKIWKKYNFEYLLIVPKDKAQTVEIFLSQNADNDAAWQLAVENAKNASEENPSDIDYRFNLVVALHNIGEYQQAIDEYEKIEPYIKLKRLWYQIEPINSYFEVGDYQRVLDISQDVLDNGNRAYSELYILRGKVFLEQGKDDLAQAEFEKALFYNKNLPKAKELTEN